MSRLLEKLEINVVEEDGSIFAEVDTGKGIETHLLARDDDIELKTEIAFDNIISEIICELENFSDRANIDSLISAEFSNASRVKRGRREDIN